MKFIALPVPEIKGGTQKIWAVSGYAHGPFSSKFVMDFCSGGACEYICQICSPYSFAFPSDCRFGLGLQTPNLGEGEAVGGRGWYRSKERLSSYRPYIVTFPLSLRVSEILPLLCSSTPLFPTAPLDLPQIFPWSPESKWMAFGPRRAKANCPCN